MEVTFKRLDESRTVDVSPNDFRGRVQHIMIECDVIIKSEYRLWKCLKKDGRWLPWIFCLYHWPSRINSLLVGFLDFGLTRHIEIFSPGPLMRNFILTWWGSKMYVFTSRFIFGIFELQTMNLYSAPIETYIYIYI